MTDLVLLIVRLHGVREAATELLHGKRLAKPRNVIVFTFHGEQADPADGG